MFVWHAPPKGGNCTRSGIRNCTGQRRWFIYYAADNGENENHCMWALESEGSDHKAVSMPRAIATGGWAIDGTVLTMEAAGFSSFGPGGQVVKTVSRTYTRRHERSADTGRSRVLLCVPINHGNARPCRFAKGRRS